jgi:hypothetical protein
MVIGEVPESGRALTASVCGTGVEDGVGVGDAEGGLLEGVIDMPKELEREGLREEMSSTETPLRMAA